MDHDQSSAFLLVQIKQFPGSVLLCAAFSLTCHLNFGKSLRNLSLTDSEQIGSLSEKNFKLFQSLIFASAEDKYDQVFHHPSQQQKQWQDSKLKYNYSVSKLSWKILCFKATDWYQTTGILQNITYKVTSA